MPSCQAPKIVLAATTVPSNDNYSPIISSMKYHEGVGYGEYIRACREKKYGLRRRLRRAFVAALSILTWRSE